MPCNYRQFGQYITNCWYFDCNTCTRELSVWPCACLSTIALALYSHALPPLCPTTTSAHTRLSTTYFVQLKNLEPWCTHKDVVLRGGLWVAACTLYGSRGQYLFSSLFVWSLGTYICFSDVVLSLYSFGIRDYVLLMLILVNTVLPRLCCSFFLPVILDDTYGLV